jgi:hypothetical protein
MASDIRCQASIHRYNPETATRQLTSSSESRRTAMQHGLAVLSIFRVCEEVRKRRDNKKKRVESHCATLNISALRAMILSRVRAHTPKRANFSRPLVSFSRPPTNNSAYTLRRTYAF